LPAELAGLAGEVATDVQFELLRLHSGAARLDPDGLGRMLRAAGYGRNPLDFSFAWQLLTSLHACGAVSAKDLAGDVDEAVDRVASGLLLQLHLLGGVAAARWSVYVALHVGAIGFASPGDGGADADDEDDDDDEMESAIQAQVLQLRDSTIREVLARSAPDWCGDAQTQRFFTQTLGVPRAWLHEAQALYAGAQRQYALQLVHLLAAEQWEAAHAVFVAHVAPYLFLEGTSATGGGTSASSTLEALARAAFRLAEHRDVIAGWSGQGCLYATYCDLFVSSSSGGNNSSRGADDGALVEFAQQLTDARLALLAGGDDSASSPYESVPPETRQAVLGRMATNASVALLRAADQAQQQQQQQQHAQALRAVAMQLHVADDCHRACRLAAVAAQALQPV
jgi:nuclear pore complex protein Nup98-Nup96